MSTINKVSRVDVTMGSPNKGDVFIQVVRWIDKTPRFHTDFIRQYKPTPASLKRTLDVAPTYFNTYGAVAITFEHKDGKPWEP